MCAVPCAAADTRPVESTVATPVASLCQITGTQPFCATVDASSGVAASWTAKPGGATRTPSAGARSRLVMFAPPSLPATLGENATVVPPVVADAVMKRFAVVAVVVVPLASNTESDAEPVAALFVFDVSDPNPP